MQGASGQQRMAGAAGVVEAVAGIGFEENLEIAVVAVVVVVVEVGIVVVVAGIAVVFAGIVAVEAGIVVVEAGLVVFWGQS